jgi:hypothetical protein
MEDDTTTTPELIVPQIVEETTTVYVPGGKDPDVPPVPFVPGHEVVPGDDGEYLEFGDDDTPLGHWTYDPDTDEWVYEEFPPTTNLPLTNGTDHVLLFLNIGLGLVCGGTLLLLRKRRSLH